MNKYELVQNIDPSLSVYDVLTAAISTWKGTCVKYKPTVLMLPEKTAKALFITLE